MCNYVAYNRFYKRHFYIYVAYVWNILTSDILWGSESAVGLIRPLVHLRDWWVKIAKIEEKFTPILNWNLEMQLTDFSGCVLDPVDTVAYTRHRAANHFLARGYKTANTQPSK